MDFTAYILIVITWGDGGKLRSCSHGLAGREIMKAVQMEYLDLFTGSK